MKYCAECGELLELRWVASEGRDRSVCPRCNAIRYDNPRILVSTVVFHERRLLLCRRAQEPSMGRWNLPAGFLERGETLEVAVRGQSRDSYALGALTAAKFLVTQPAGLYTMNDALGF